MSMTDSVEGMMLKSLEKLRNICDNSPLSKDSILGDQVEVSCRYLADEIKAEIDEKYVPRVGAAYQMLADPKLDDEAVNSAYEILKKHGTLDAYIDKFYLPRPLFEDGKPADFRDDFVDCFGDTRKINKIVYIEEIGYHVFDADGHGVLISYGECLRRPLKPDTQEKIYADIELAPKDYCEKYGLDTTHGQRIYAKTRHLLARQRELGGVE